MDKEVNINHDKNLINLLAEVGVSDCKTAVKNFLKLLDLPEDLLEHIFETKVIVDYSDKYSNELVSYYEANKDGDNTIHILASYIDEVITRIDNNYRNNFESNLETIPITLMHEFLHVNRDVMLKGNTNISNKELDDLLFKRLNSGRVGKIVLLRVTTSEDNRYKCEVYNGYNNSYETYYYDKANITGNVFNKLERKIQRNYYIGKLFNSSKKTPSSSESISKDDIIINNYSVLNNDSFNMEEALTEAFARIIIEHRFKYKLCIYEICDHQLSNNKLPKDLVIAFNMIKNMDLDTIRWYLLSCYEDCLNNKLEYIFDSDYDELCDSFDNKDVDKGLKLIKKRMIN